MATIRPPTITRYLAVLGNPLPKGTPEVSSARTSSAVEITGRGDELQVAGSFSIGRVGKSVADAEYASGGLLGAARRREW
jgi:hypothetical protein